MMPTGSRTLLLYSPEAFQPYGHCHDYVRGLAGGLAQTGVEVAVVGWDGPLRLADRIPTVRVPQPPYAQRRRSTYGRLGPVGDMLWGLNRARSEGLLLRALRQAIQEREPGAVLFESFEYASLARFLHHHRLRTILGCVLHDTNFNVQHVSPVAAGYKHLMRYVVRRIVAATTVTLVHGPEMRANLIRVLGLTRAEADRIDVLPYGAPAPDAVVHIARSEARQRLGLPQNLPTLLAFGTLRTDKRFDLLFEAVSAAPGWQLLIAGPEGDVSYADLEALIHRSGIAPRTRVDRHFIPPEQHPVYFGAADVVTALYDPRMRHESGTVQLARSFLRPVITAGSPDLRDYIRATGAGWWLEAARPAEFSALLNDLLQTNALAAPDLAERVRMAAVERSWPVVARRLANRLLGIPHPREAVGRAPS